MNKWVVEDWKFELTVIEGKTSNCRLGFEKGDKFVFTYECPQGMCPRAMTELYTWCEVIRCGGDFTYRGFRDKYEMTMPCPCKNITFHLKANPINRDKNGKALTRQCQSDGTPGTESASSWAWFDASMILDADDQTKITNKTITVDVANGSLKIYVKEMGEEGLGELVARTADNPEIPVDAVSSELPYTAFVASKSDNVFENVIISDFRVSGENAGQRTVFNKFDAQTINDWSVYKTDKTTSMYFGYDYSLKLNSKFSNEYPLMIRNMVSINEPDDLYSYAKVISKIKVNTLAQNSKIGFLSGVEKLSDAKIGQAKTTFVYLVKDGNDVKLGIDSYHTANQVKEILAPTIVSVDDQGFVQVESQIDHKGKIKVVANGTDVYESTQDNEGYAKRYIGVALSGAKTGLDVEFADVKLVNQFYQRPQNTNILATFEDDPTTTDVDESDSFNKNEWHLQSFPYLDTYTNTAYVNDGQLVFENLAMNTSFATKRQYSDFEIQIDITDLRREVVKDASGNKNFPISAFIGIYWGVPTADFKFGNGVGSAYPHIYIGPEVDIDTWDRQKDDNGKNKPVLIRCQGVGLDNMFELPSHYDFWDPIMEGEVLQYKIKVVEKDVTVSVKYDFEDEWYVIANLKLSRAMVGSVGITTMGCNYYVPVISEGASCGWCKLDNIKVTNLDNKPNLTTLEYAVSRSNMPQDFPYVDKNNDEEYLIKDGQESSGCSSSFNAGMIAVGTISACASLFVVRKLRGKKDEEI